MPHIVAQLPSFEKQIPAAKEKKITQIQVVTLDLRCNKSTVCKPSSVLDDHLSRIGVTADLKRMCRDTEQVFGLISCTGRGLHERTVAIAFVGSYPTFPPLQRQAVAVYFCCTFLEVAFTGRYPAPLLSGARTFLVSFLPQSSDCLLPHKIIYPLSAFVNCTALPIAPSLSLLYIGHPLRKIV